MVKSARKRHVRQDGCVMGGLVRDVESCGVEGSKRLNNKNDVKEAELDLRAGSRGGSMEAFL